MRRVNLWPGFHEESILRGLYAHLMVLKEEAEPVHQHLVTPNPHFQNG